MGSRVVVGDLQPSDLDKRYNGIPLPENLRRIGGDPTKLAEARMPRGSIHCYLELHIEQGGTLDKAGIPIGVVEGIAALMSTRLRFTVSPIMPEPRPCPNVATPCWPPPS